MILPRSNKFPAKFTVLLFLLATLLSCATTPLDRGQYFTGDGGRGTRLAVLEPSGRGLAVTEQWILPMIQSSITGDFQMYSAMTIIDRQNLEKILGEQRQSLSGNYSDEDFISIGRLTNARYILTGSITRTANTYMLELAVTDAETGERRASYPPRAVTSASLENLSAIKEATADLLRQLGVNLTEQGLRDLRRSASINQMQAQEALARGITAQRQGTVVEALSFYIQANNYDSGLAEAASRMNILTANISSGNIGEDTRNDIAWRRQWVERLQEAETFYTRTLNEPQPYYIVYSTNIQRGTIDYQRETISLSIRMGFYPDFAWANQINGVISTVSNGLNATKRTVTWELDWPKRAITAPSPFIDRIKNFTSNIVVEIINDQGRSIGRQTVRVGYGYVIKDAAVTPLWQWEGDVSFPAVNANLITDRLTIQITSIDGVAAETASHQKRISIMPETEWQNMLRRNRTLRQSIETERNLHRAKVLLDQGIQKANARNFNNAIADLTESIRLNPNVSDAYFWRGWVYAEQKQYNKAISDYTEAIRLEPNNSLYRYNLQWAKNQNKSRNWSSNKSYVFVGYKYIPYIPFGMTLGINNFYGSINFGFGDSGISYDSDDDYIFGQIEWFVGYTIPINKYILIPIGLGFNHLFIPNDEIINKFAIEAGLQIVCFDAFYLFAAYRLIGFTGSGFSFGVGYAF